MSEVNRVTSDAIVEKLTELSVLAVSLEAQSVDEDGRKFIVTFDEPENEEQKTFNDKHDELSIMVNDTLITADGRHSKEFFELRNNPTVKTKCFEEDSFGPLVMGLATREHNLWFTYD